MMDVTARLRDTALPDPAHRPELYDDTPTKRALAWMVDMAVVATATVVATLLLILPTLGVAILAMPLIWIAIDFAYRCATLARGSATWGMRLFAVELRDHDDRPLDFGTALAHTALYLVAMAALPLQVLSAVMMLGTPRRQGLGDHLLGTAAVNHRAR